MPVIWRGPMMMGAVRQFLKDTALYVVLLEAAFRSTLICDECAVFVVSQS